MALAPGQRHIYARGGTAVPLLGGPRPRYGLDDVLVLLFRQLPMMAVVFLVLAALGVALAFQMPRTYTARSDLLVQLAQEYVYEPRAGDAARGAIPELTDVVQAEVAILGGDEVRRRVVRRLGASAILGEEATGTEADMEVAALRALGAGLEVGTAPDTGVVNLSYEHRNAEGAATILNAIVATYLDYRREVFRDVTSPLIEDQRAVIERQLDSADEAYEAFLSTNDIGDYGTERATVAASYQAVYADVLAVEAQLRQAEGRVASLTAEMADVPAVITLQQDLNLSAPDRILQLRTEREALLSRYEADASPVRDIDEQIAQLEAFVASGTAVGVRDMRTGPNPVWVELEAQRVQAEAERAALASRLTALRAQLATLEARQSELIGLESRNGNLAAEREVLAETWREFTARAAQARASSELAQNGADSIRVIQPATPPARGQSLKAVVAAVAVLLAGFTALCLGLVRVFLDRRFVTAAGTGRTLGLPVLATAPVKR